MLMCSLDVLVTVSFRFANKLQQTRVTEPGETAGIESSTLIIFKSEPYVLDAYLGKKSKLYTFRAVRIGQSIPCLPQITQCT